MIHLVDTGPLVSALARRESRFQRWAQDQFRRLPAPLVTCEAVLTEASHLLGTATPLLEAIERGLVVCRFDLQTEAVAVNRLCTKYSDQPMDLADACLVRLYETARDGAATILTVDRRDFSVYRTSKGKRLQCLFPPH